MATCKHSSLRQLAVAYYKGHIARDRYLELRSQYLQAITEGKEPTPISSEDIASEIFDISSTRTTDRDRQNKVLLISILIALLIIVIIAIVAAAVSNKPLTSQNPADTRKPNSSIQGRTPFGTDYSSTIQPLDINNSNGKPRRPALLEDKAIKTSCQGTYLIGLI